MMRKLISGLLLAVLLASCAVVAGDRVGNDDIMAVIRIRPEYVFWGDSEHYRVISCDPVVIDVDESTAMSLWAIYDAVMWDDCKGFWHE